LLLLIVLMTNSRAATGERVNGLGMSSVGETEAARVAATVGLVHTSFLLSSSR
jgi:hypothetical protein